MHPEWRNERTMRSDEAEYEYVAKMHKNERVLSEYLNIVKVGIEYNKLLKEINKLKF